MKIKEFQLNHENQRNLIILCENKKKYANHKIICANHENHLNLLFLFENQENHAKN